MSVLVGWVEVRLKVEAAADAFDFTAGDAAAAALRHLQAWPSPSPVMASSYPTGGGTNDSAADDVSLDCAAITPTYGEGDVEQIAPPVEDCDSVL